MIKNANGEQLDLFVVSAKLEPRLNASSSTLLNGKWFSQTIGDPAEVLKVRVICKLDVVREIMEYYKTTETLSVTFLDFAKEGFIIGSPNYDLAERGLVNPRYYMDFEMAVTGDV